MKFRSSRESCGNRSIAVAALSILAFSLLHSHPHPGASLAYVGPGAGFAFLGSFLSIVAGFFLTLASLLAWPFRMAWRMARSRRGFRHAKVHRAIFLGLDGLDPKLTERFMNEGRLPSLARAQRRRLPAAAHYVSVALSSGVVHIRHWREPGPAQHFRFSESQSENLHTGIVFRARRASEPRAPAWQAAHSARPPITMGRRSVPFWKLLGEHNVGCSVIRVPVTFPSEPFNGKLLSAMCTPDLRGTQGSFSFFSTAIEKATYESGMRYPLRRNGDVATGELEGPDDPLVESGGALSVPFQIDFSGTEARFKIDGQTYALRAGEYTPWISARFRGSLGVTAHGIVRFLPRETAPEVSLYATPVEIVRAADILPKPGLQFLALCYRFVTVDWQHADRQISGSCRVLPPASTPLRLPRPLHIYVRAC
jgi:hypothetical protein